MTTKRITNTNIIELDKKIAVEIYLKEKKDAIIEDRKDPQKDVETESNLDKVRAKYQDLMKSVDACSQNKRSSTMSTRAKSICGSIQETAAQINAITSSKEDQYPEELRNFK